MFQGSFAAHKTTLATTWRHLRREPAVIPNDKWGWAVQGALQFKNIPTGAGDTINMQAVYTDGATRYNFQSLAPQTSRCSAAPVCRAPTRALASLLRLTVCSSNRNRQLDTSQTWGFRGAFNHNWDPFWNSALYGAYAAVNYKTTARPHLRRSRSQRSRRSPLGSHLQPGLQRRPARLHHPLDPGEEPDVLGGRHLDPLDQKYVGTITVPAGGSRLSPSRRCVRAEGSGHLEPAAPRSAQLVIPVDLTTSEEPRRETAGVFLFGPDCRDCFWTLRSSLSLTKLHGPLGQVLTERFASRMKGDALPEPRIGRPNFRQPNVTGVTIYRERTRLRTSA